MHKHGLITNDTIACWLLMMMYFHLSLLLLFRAAVLDGGEDDYMDGCYMTLEVPVLDMIMTIMAVAAVVVVHCIHLYDDDGDDNGLFVGNADAAAVDNPKD
mmetsp:Transcript_23219/g.23602  ORF Transcript_23219/g.23602 Transcript_23219/m.23602 type:complete len:101 (+) Transcript_23219:182-484(+)